MSESEDREAGDPEQVEKSKSARKHNEGGTRWWEFYFIRYGMGTVVGALTLYQLSKAAPELKSFIVIDPTTKLDATQLTIFVAFGLTFCYIASAPILVFHAARFLLRLPNGKESFSLRRFSVAFIVPLLCAAIGWHLAMSTTIPAKLLNATISFLATFIIWNQFVAAIATLRFERKMYEFYQHLADSRHRESGGIVESYRHLREHGNSFFIVLLEFILGLILFSTSESLYPIIILLWILPAVLIWLVATYFERRFCGIEKS